MPLAPVAEQIQASVFVCRLHLVSLCCSPTNLSTVTMASSLSPYEPVTFVFTDQSAIMRFYPDRDGLITNDWNVTYTGSSFVDWSYDHNFGTGVRFSRLPLLSSCLMLRL